MIKMMISEIDRANSIITEFLSLARHQSTEKKKQNINDILQKLYPLLEADTYTQNKQIVLTTQTTPDILLDYNEISQLILNLCRNGLEAMSEQGTLTLGSYVEDHQVVLFVQDEGSGIPQQYLDKLGIPFFTTKDTGTGLGLATCYSIAERHNARIKVESNPSGTIFRVFFPAR
jgi:signal transduction histidine kinase